MNVRDLILELQKQNPALMVVVDGYEGGFNELERVGIITVGLKNLNVNKEGEWWMGEYEEGTEVDVVYLPRG